MFTLTMSTRRKHLWKFTYPPRDACDRSELTAPTVLKLRKLSRSDPVWAAIAAKSVYLAVSKTVLDVETYFRWNKSHDQSRFD
jgi:hypothetical protein